MVYVFLPDDEFPPALADELLLELLPQPAIITAATTSPAATPSPSFKRDIMRSS
jgi:hypothetical protein